MNRMLHQLRRASLLDAGLADGQLLEGFISRRDEAAFEVLVRRHGPMVLGVCRRILRNLHDAEDAFQATFLVLACKAASILPREMVGNWLHGVAYHTALKAKAMNAKRRANERAAAALPKPQGPDDVWRQLEVFLDHELQKLPDKYRAAIVLCDLEGKSRKEAASHLGCAEGTVASRLARARRLLAKRLARHGVTPGSAVLAETLSRSAASAYLPSPLLAATLKATSLLSADWAAVAGAISADVAALTKGMLKAMLLTKLKTATGLLFAVGAVAVAGALLQGALVQNAASAPPASKVLRPDGADTNPPALMEKSGIIAVVRSIDARQRKITVGMSTNAGTMVEATYPVAKDVKIFRKGDDTTGPAKLEDVEVGQGVVIHMVDPAKDPTVIGIHLVRIQLTLAGKDDLIADKDRASLVEALRGHVNKAKQELALSRERASWSERMHKKGFITAAQAEADQEAVKAATLALKRLIKELEVLE
jgi:RNA polymerase sigma factor (sigma-70 family)